MAEIDDHRLPKRFWDKVVPEPNSGCWLWTAHCNRGGYGCIGFRGTVQKAHRVTYVVLVGAIPAGLQLDHLCRVRCCCNPAHLEPVTPKENSQRGTELKICCPQGHRLEAPNLVTRKDGFRDCRECKKARSLAEYANRR